MLYWLRRAGGHSNRRLRAQHPGTPLRIIHDHLVLLRFGLEAAVSARTVQGYERLETDRSDTAYNLICEV